MYSEAFMLDFIPDLQLEHKEGTRGGEPLALTRDQMISVWRSQHGYVYQPYHPMLLSDSYAVIKEDFMYDALRKYHDFLMAVIGSPPQEVYLEGVYVCLEFAYVFKAFLTLCHRANWTQQLGHHKLAVAWSVNAIAKGNERIPDNHALITTIAKTKTGLEVQNWEPQLESYLAKYRELERTGQLTSQAGMRALQQLAREITVVSRGFANCAQFYSSVWH